MEFYVTLPPGLEDVVADEITGLGGNILEIREGKGRVFFEGNEVLIAKLNYLARCIERVILLLRAVRFEKLEKKDDLDHVYRAIRDLDFSFLQERSFAIRSMRIGSHEFTSMDVARVAGQAVIDSFLENYGKRLRVDLTNPDVIIRVDVVHKELLVGIDTTGDDALHKRWWRVYNHPAHLNSNIACAMIKIAEWSRNESLVDPMCGSGTIPIEAAMIGRDIPPGKNRDFAFLKIDWQEDLNFIVSRWKESKERIEIYGIEKFRKHLEGARKNAENAGVADTVNFFLGDATKLEGEYDCIIVNPPYGLRIAKKGVIKTLYEKFVEAAKRCMHDESRLVIITSEYELIKSVFEKTGLIISEERYVRYGGLATKLFLARR